MKYALGVDLGGTNIRIAVCDENGNLYEVKKKPTESKNDINALILEIVNLIKSVDYQKYNIDSVGIGVPGPTKSDGTVIYMGNLGISDPINLKEEIEKRINLKVFIGNDANVAGLAEAIVGNGKGYDVVQYITLSTGIGGGLIINGKMVVGKYGLAQEIGNMVVNVGGLAPSIYKSKGCIEGEASGTMLTYKANLKGLNVLHAGDVFKLANNGNEIAKDLVKEEIEYLAAFIGAIVAYMEPDIFVIGGGLMKSKEYFFDSLILKVNDYVHSSLRNKIRIVAAKYDQDCGIIGAAMQCF